MSRLYRVAREFRAFNTESVRVGTHAWDGDMLILEWSSLSLLILDISCQFDGIGGEGPKVKKTGYGKFQHVLMRMPTGGDVGATASRSPVSLHSNGACGGMRSGIGDKPLIEQENRK